MFSVGNSHRSASSRPTTLEEDQELFVDFSSILCLWFEIQAMRTYNIFDWARVSNTGYILHQVAPIDCSAASGKQHEPLSGVWGIGTLCHDQTWLKCASKQDSFKKMYILQYMKLSSAKCSHFEVNQHALQCMLVDFKWPHFAEWLIFFTATPFLSAPCQVQ